MAGIRTFNTNLPHVHRLPEWTSGVFYPKGSIVAEQITENGQVYNNYYVAINDVQNQDTAPSKNQDSWRPVYEDPGYDSDILALLKDSDFIVSLTQASGAVQLIRSDVDSETLRLDDVDSDFRLKLDSERHDWQAADSDIYTRIDQEVHDLEGADSDIKHLISQLDSDVAYLKAQADSDSNAIAELKKDVVNNIDSEIRARMAADSDFDILVTRVIHDYLAEDSEIDSDVLTIKKRLDSEFDAAIRQLRFTGDDFNWDPKPWQTNTRYNIDEGEITNHIIGYLWIASDITDSVYIVLNGNLLISFSTVAGQAPSTTEFTDANGVVWRRGTQIEESPGDPADIAIYQNTSAGLPLATNGKVYAVAEKYENQSNFVQQTSLEDAFRRTVTTIVAIDSDVNFLKVRFQSFDSDNDSELNQLGHDIDRHDSDIFYLRKDVDSDSKVIQRLRFDIDSERRDWKNSDSDIRRLIAEGLESDINANRQRIIILEERLDSEIQNSKDRDSEILNGYTSVTPRWIKTEHSPPSIGGGVNLNFDVGGNVIGNTGSGVWIWNSVNDRLVIIDSDNTVIYNEVHAEEPTVVSDGQTQYRRGIDTGTNGTIQVNGATQGTADVWEFYIDYISKTKTDGTYTPIIDSDLNLKKWDSDNTAALVHIVDTIQEEVHWRRSRDSDLSVRITDNDSDIAYINQVGVFFRGSVDMTENLPTHTAIRTGDVYLNTKTGTVVDDSEWRNLADTSISENQFVMFTDSDQWRVLGGLGEGGADSENIAYVSSIRDYRLAIQRDRFKFHFAEQSQTLFFEGDSEEFFIIDAESWNNKSPVILEGRLLSGTQVQLYFGGVGRNTAGNIFVYSKDGAEKNITNSFGFYSPNLLGNGISFAGFGSLSSGTDSDDNTVRINVSAGFELGDKIQFIPEDGVNNTWLQTWDNLNFKRIPKIKIDLDSDVHDRKAADSEIHDRLDSEYHDRKASDSDILIIIADNDSEIRRMLDSEIHDRKSADSDLQVQITDNDSDIAYLYGETVKFRGTIDPTVDAPAHTAIQPGDLYVSYKSGAIASGWSGIVGYGVAEGDALLYTDSDKWIFLGAGDNTDSENISTVPSASWYLEQSNVKQNKLHWGSRSRALFAEIDSDVLLQILTDHENFSRIIDGEMVPGQAQQVRLSFSGAGARTNGILKYITQDDDDLELQIVSGATGTFENDSDLEDFAVTDSENQVVIVSINNRTPVRGDVIEYRDSDLGYASRVQYDGSTAWVKWNPAQWLREDVDSEFEILRGELVSQAITGFRVGTILPFSQSDMPVGFRLADGSQFNPIQFPELAEYLGSNTLPNLQGAFLRGMANSTDYNHNAPTLAGETGLMDIGRQNYSETDFIVPTLDSEQPQTGGVTGGQRFMDIRLAGVGGLASRDGTDVVLEVEGRQGRLGIASLRQLIVSGSAVGYSPNIEGAVVNIRSFGNDWYPSMFRLIPDGPRSFEGTYQELAVKWTYADGTIRNNSYERQSGKEFLFQYFQNEYIESPVVQIDITGRYMAGVGTLRELQFSHFQKADDSDITPARTRSYNVAYGIAMYNGAGIVYDSELLRNIWNELTHELDSEIRRMDSDLQYNLDSEYRARKDADSDLLSQTGRTFVSDNPPTGVSPDLRNGDTWIDSSDQRLYYYDGDALAWVQVISSVQP